MIRGQFNPRGELIFEIELIATDGDDAIPVNVLLDTGFTGWFAIDDLLFSARISIVHV
jgi:predicted aspartyl protease